MINKNKKGIQLNQAVGAILTIVLLAVLVIVSIFLFSNLGNSMIGTQTSASVANETTTLITTTGTALSCSNQLNGYITSAIVTNSTSGVIVEASTNYTLNNPYNCYIRSTAASSYRDEHINVSYTYTYNPRTAASNASDTMITNFSAYPALVGLVGTIIFLGIIIGVLIASFVFGKKERA